MTKSKHTGVMAEIDRDVAKRNKKEKDMKRVNINWKTIWTVILTLLFVFWTAGAVYLGMQYNQSVNDRVHAEAKVLSELSVKSESKK